MSKLMPSSSIPLAYYTFAHAGLATALLALVIDPAMAGVSFYHPRTIALVHLLTLAWLSGSILGSFYIVAPLALRLPMPAGTSDRVAFGSFVLGTIGMVYLFWITAYQGIAWPAGLVAGAFLWVAWRAWRGLPASGAPWPVALHVALAFFNILAAALLGILIGLNRTRGFLEISPLATMFAHLHLAAVGWAVMMVIGLSYRLIPMILPAAMPTGAALAISAVLLEGGLAVLVTALIARASWTLAGAGLIVAGLASFVVLIRRTLKHRLPRPPALPARDWSTWQTHAAFAWLLVAAGLGIALASGVAAERRLTVMWIYGVAGLVGFLAQIVAGMQGRLVPLYAWYRAFAARGVPPHRGANALPSTAFARPLFFSWSTGVPLLALGFGSGRIPLIRSGALVLLAAVVLGAVYVAYLLRAAGFRPVPPGS